MDSSTLIKWHLKRASGLRKWVDTIKIVEEYPILSRVPARNDFNKKEILQIKIVSFFRFYNMIHVQLWKQVQFYITLKSQIQTEHLQTW